MTVDVETAMLRLNAAFEEAFNAHPEATLSNATTFVAQVDPLRLDSGYLISFLADVNLVIENAELRRTVIGRIRAADPGDRWRFYEILMKHAPELFKEISGSDAA